MHNTKIVVPAQAGTQTPQRLGSITKAQLFFIATNARGNGSPPARGRRRGGL